jgi:hypothetical protein
MTLAPRRVLSPLGFALTASLLFAACGGDDANGTTPGVDGGAAPGSDGGGASTDGSVVIGDATVPPPPAPVCDAPILAVDVSHPTTVVGTGTASSCTEAALSSALVKGGVVTFDCGGAATIAIASELTLAKGKDVTVDGGGKVTLDGGGKTRLFHFDGGNFRVTKTVITLQHLTLTGAKSTGTKIPPAPAPCSQGFETDGGGAAVLVRDGVLHVVDVTFVGNAAASPGPDVAGGAVYVIGSLDTTIVLSRFVGNTASNGGAVGSLFSNLTLANDTFTANLATGTGANSTDNACQAARGNEVGDGGNGAAVVMDGGEEFAVSICGSVFANNTGGALGGAVFRTPDINRQKTTIDRSTFDGNTSKGGGALYFHHSDLTVLATTFSNNSAEGAGAIQADDTTLDMTNVTLTNNSATKSLGGAVSLFGNGGHLVNCTFEGNHADAGSGIFGAAIAGNTTFTIDNTVFANNTTKDAGAPMTCQDGSSTGAGDVQWPRNHLVGSNPDSACVAGITFADAKLDALKDSGGPTKTMTPLTGSGAIGIGKACPAFDQRGKPRKQPDGCTAGAVEVL